MTPFVIPYIRHSPPSSRDEIIFLDMTSDELHDLDVYRLEVDNELLTSTLNTQEMNASKKLEHPSGRGVLHLFTDLIGQGLLLVFELLHLVIFLLRFFGIRPGQGFQFSGLGLRRVDQEPSLGHAAVSLFSEFVLVSWSQRLPGRISRGDRLLAQSQGFRYATDPLLAASKQGNRFLGVASAVHHQVGQFISVVEMIDVRVDGLPKLLAIVAVATERFHVQGNPRPIFYDQVEHYLIEVWAVVPAVALGQMYHLRIFSGRIIRVVLPIEDDPPDFLRSG